MKSINSGRLRAIGFDARHGLLRVRLEDGTTLEYTGVGHEVWRRLSTSGSAWSVYRDSVEEEFSARRVRSDSAESPPRENPLDDLWRQT